jgi:hypothetical protein
MPKCHPHAQTIEVLLQFQKTNYFLKNTFGVTTRPQEYDNHTFMFIDPQMNQSSSFDFL